MKTTIYISRITGIVAVFLFLFTSLYAQQQMKINTQMKVLQQPSRAGVVTDPVDMTVCEGGSVLFFIADTGTAPITYQWLFNGNPLPFTDDTLILPGVALTDAGGYQCVATNGCGSDTSNTAVLTVNPLPVIYNVTGGGGYCAGSTGVTVTLDGSESGIEYQLLIDSSPSGATVPGTGSPLSWPNQTLTGQYNISALNSVTGCSSDMSGLVMVISNPQPIVSVSSSGNPICNGLCDGTVTYSVTSGTPPITYDIGTQNNTLGIFSGLCDGNYTVTVTDFNGCTDTISAALTGPPLLTVSASVAANITCYGYCDGTIIATASGGMPFYTYTWNTVPVQNTSTATAICAGTYSVTVMDMNGCTESSNVIITQPDTVLINATLFDASCIGDDGQITAAPTGGNGSYTYLWNTSDVSDGIDSLAAGTFSLTVTDILGCVSVDTFVLQQVSINPVIKGQVSYSGGNFGPGDAAVKFYNEIDNPTGSIIYEYFGETLTGAAGYELQVLSDVYILQAVLPSPSSFPGVFSTYYSLTPVIFTNNWEDAEPLTLGCNDTMTVDIIMAENPNVIPGTVTLTGIILYWDGGTKGITTKGDRAIGEPVEGAEVFLEQQPNDEPVANTATDTSGVYTMNNIEEGYTYDMTVDIPGIPLLSTYTSIVVNTGTTLIEDLNFWVDTTTTIGGIFIDTLTGISSQLSQVKYLNIYPNPASDMLFVEVVTASECNLKITISDMSGRSFATLMEEKGIYGNKKYSLKLSDIPKGNYILTASVGKDNFIRKFVKE